MLAMVTDLLDLARIEAGITLQLAPVSLIMLLQECYDSFAVLAERKQITLGVVVPAEDCTMTIDLQQFNRVMNNLLTNAIKYTPEGGQVQIGAQVEPDRVIISVADTGLGIPEEDMPRLFDRFFRVRQATHMQVEGTGLGLSITKAIVEQHQGQILVESRLGQGSTFSVVLPLIG
jgi:signal transduction histidine kinase